MINFNDPKGFYTLGMSCEYSGGGQLESNSLQRSSATHYFCQCSLLTPSASGFEIYIVGALTTNTDLYSCCYKMSPLAMYYIYICNVSFTMIDCYVCMLKITCM